MMNDEWQRMDLLSLPFMYLFIAQKFPGDFQRGFSLHRILLLLYFFISGNLVSSFETSPRDNKLILFLKVLSERMASCWSRT